MKANISHRNANGEIRAHSRTEVRSVVVTFKPETGAIKVSVYGHDSVIPIEESLYTNFTVIGVHRT